MRSRLVPVVAAMLFAVIPHGASAGDYPVPWNSTVPTSIRLVGTRAGLPDAAAGQFTIVARSRMMYPAVGAQIVVDFSGCPDVVICADQSDPDALINCGAKTVRKPTNTQGEVTFTILGASVGGSQASSLSNSVRIYGDGMLLGSPSVAVYDLNGSGGVGVTDLSVWLTDFASGGSWSRSDYNGDGVLSPFDLSLWLTVFNRGASAQSCSIACPP